MITLNVSIQEIKPGLLTVAVYPSDKALGTELEIDGGTLVLRSINVAVDLIMHSADKSQNYAGEFVTPEWSSKLVDRLKKQK